VRITEAVRHACCCKLELAAAALVLAGLAPPLGKGSSVRTGLTVPERDKGRRFHLRAFLVAKTPRRLVGIPAVRSMSGGWWGMGWGREGVRVTHVNAAMHMWRTEACWCWNKM